MTILIVEDEPSGAILLRRILEHGGHTVIIATDGTHALEVLDERPDVELVMADIQMPEMDGISLLKAVRERPDLQDLPVLFVSATADADTVREAAHLGSQGYLLKPITEPSKVLERVNAIARQYPALLADPDACRARAGLTGEEVHARCVAFSERVHGALEEIEEKGALRAESAAALREYATTLGARRLLRRLDAGAAGGERALLVRELRALTFALPVLTD